MSDDVDRTAEYLELIREDQRAEAIQNGSLFADMFNGAWLDTQTFPPLECAVPGIIPEGFGVLAAPPKTGKSWLVCGIGLACAAGGTALGTITAPQRPVFYLALEDGQRRLQTRCRRIMANLAACVGGRTRSTRRAQPHFHTSNHEIPDYLGRS